MPTPRARTTTPAPSAPPTSSPRAAWILSPLKPASTPSTTWIPGLAVFATADSSPAWPPDGARSSSPRAPRSSDWTAALSSLYRASTAVHFNFDVRTRLVSATPPLRSPKKYDAFWAIGGAVYALDTSADEPSHGKERCVFERLGPEPQRHYGTWQWEAPPPAAVQDGPYRGVPRRAPGRRHRVPVRVQYKTGTFSFDAERLEWARHGDWVLPFDGEGYYVRDLDAWVGLCSRHRGRLAACRVVDDDRSGGAEPACKCGEDLLFRQMWRRHDSASLVYMGNARFCLLETVTQPHQDRTDTRGLIVPMLLRVVTFRVRYSWDGELCVVNRRAKVYKLPWQSSSEKPRAFWI
ncbi:hypothetical protein SORBI_3002G323800 [Sorghum bicolor]|uniref:Uncharacterized protein n=1 Tax=Sorghum bicolor TaxID=4558 RepID=A0A1B6QEN7_SORBI|nr:hypothetical protein SORBI_3002G323800 [Sorghum bicolor]